MFLKPCFYMVIIHSQVVERLVSGIIKLYHLIIGLIAYPWSNFMIQWLILIQWSLRITDALGTWLLSFVENCPLLGDF